MTRGPVNQLEYTQLSQSFKNTLYLSSASTSWTRPVIDLDTSYIDIVTGFQNGQFYSYPGFVKNEKVTQFPTNEDCFHVKNPNDGYDPRCRQWYVDGQEMGKGKTGLVNPYMALTNNFVYVTMVQESDHGVSGIDLDMNKWTDNKINQTQEKYFLASKSNTVFFGSETIS